MTAGRHVDSGPQRRPYRPRDTLIPLGPDLPAAACKGVGQPLWDFQAPLDSPWQRVERYSRAAAICAGCPERTNCTPGPDDDGIYAGVLFIKGRPVEPLMCAWTGCGQPFISSDPDFQYCSHRCQREAALARGRTKREAAA